MSLELGPRGLSVFDDYAKGSGNGQKHRKGIPGVLALFVGLKVQFAILIPYTFCYIKQIAPRGLLAVHSRFALK